MAGTKLPLPVISLWDPRATSSGSIDPLGALRAYNAIAGFLLPGVTTITTRVRYLTWLCAGLRLLDDVAGAPFGGQAGRARRHRLLAWERLLVLATARYAVAAGAAQNSEVWRGLRGISYARRAVQQDKKSTDFELLRNQAGVGGTGTYWVTLVAGGLVDDASADLTPAGVRLADELLKKVGPQLRSRMLKVLAQEKVAFSVDELVELGKRASLAIDSATVGERRALEDALLEPETQRRLSASIKSSAEGVSNHAAFKRLERRLRSVKDDLADQMADTMEATRAFEALHASLLDPFDRLRAMSSPDGRVKVASAAMALRDLDELASRGEALQALLQNGCALPKAVHSGLGQFLKGLQPVLNARSASGFVEQLCRYHERVQSGKLDASRQPKHPWVSLRDNHIEIAPRFALEGHPESHEDRFTHPYRIESFVGMLAELQMLGQAA